MKAAAILLASIAAVVGCASTTRQSAAPTSVQLPGSASLIVSRAEEALNSPASPGWRPALRADLERYLKEIGALSDAPSPGRALLNDSETWSASSAAEGAVRTGPMVSATNARRLLVVAREAEFDTLDSSIVVCLGDLRARSIRNCILFVLGRAQADEIDAATICARGHVDARITRDTSLYAISR